MFPKINIAEKFAVFSDTWSPKIIAELNGQHVKLARLRGEFVWHHHETQDELFLVIAGQLRMRFRDGEVTLDPGELIVVPAGIEHQPVAGEEAQVLLLEPATTRNTGNVDSAYTVESPAWI